MRLGRLACLFAVAACGRIGFDAPGAGGDGMPGTLEGGVPRAPTSCLGLASTCGPAGTSSCCDTLLVPGGAFFRDFDGVGYNDMSFPATVSPFFLDTYEVTVGRFRQFVMAGKGTLPSAPQPGEGGRALNGMQGQGGWDPSWNTRLPFDAAGMGGLLACSVPYQTWTNAPAGNENRPINCVDWSLAIAFCIWDGGFLPTEAEWTFAAAGGDEQRAYPWSSPPTALTLDPSRGSYAPTFDTDCVGDGLPGCMLADILPVGTRPAGNGRWGHADLGGNVYEWTLDWYEDTQVMPCNDCASMTSSLNLRAHKGGAFRYSQSALRTGYRNAWTADDWLGFRCARLP